MEQIRELLEYCPDSGVFTWKTNQRNGSMAGSVAGSVNSDGYRIMTIRRKSFKAHRLAWWFVHGAMPLQEIDHINGEKDDNRIANLRDVGRLENERNKRGFKGAYKDGNRWRAMISIRKRKQHLGMFLTEAEAEEAYRQAKYGACA